MHGAIVLLLSVLRKLLTLQFFLELSNTGPSGPFTDFVCKLATPFVTPFGALFIDPATSTTARVFSIGGLVTVVICTLLNSLTVTLVGCLRNPGTPNDL